MNHPEPAQKTPMNALKTVLSVLTLAAGVGIGRKRGHQLSEVGAGTLLLAVLIWIALGYGALRLFVYFVKAQIGG